MKATEVVWSLFESMDEIVDFLQIQLIGDTYNLKINPDDVFTDMVAYYKSNQFDPLQHLKFSTLDNQQQTLAGCCGSASQICSMHIWKIGLLVLET